MSKGESWRWFSEHSGGFSLQASAICRIRVHTLIHEMVNVCDLAHWFRNATSDRRLEALCRLLDCCMPLELQFLNSYFEELLRRNMATNYQPPDSNMPELREITNSTCRRQLCLLLTRLKSASVLAGRIYNILIQYNFSEFFSRVMIMEEELVDEILLLFTLAANHPAMSFSQRYNLHQRLLDLRETIEKSFKCYQTADVCSLHDQDYTCRPLEKSSSEEILKEQKSANEILKTKSNPQPAPESNGEETDVADSSQVHIKDLRVVRVQQRSFDKKYEYIFEVTWSNGKVVRVHRAYGELFDFQCKLRRRYSKEISRMAERKVIPYLPARRPIKFCKGNQVLPDITHYVREFAKLPEKLLHSESVETFFSDGTENKIDDKQQISNSKQICSHEKKEHANMTCKTTDASRVNTDVQFDKGTGSTRNHSPRGKHATTSVSGKKLNNSLQTSGKLESKKRIPLSPKNIANTLSQNDGYKTKTIHHQPKTILKSPNSSSNARSSTMSKTIHEEAKTNASLYNGNILRTEKSQQSFSEKIEGKHLKTINDESSEQKTSLTNKHVSSVTDLDVATSADSQKTCVSNVVQNDAVRQKSLLSIEMTSSFDMTQTSCAIPSLSKMTQGTSIYSSSTMVSPTMTLSMTKSPTITSSVSTSSNTTSSILATKTSLGSTQSAVMSSIALSSELSNPITILTSSTTASTTMALSILPTWTSSLDPIATSSGSVSIAPSSTATSPYVVPAITSSLLKSISPTSNIMTSITRSVMTSPLMTSFTTASTLTIKSPEAPLTVAVPVLSPSCTTNSISNQSSSDDSVTSSLSPPNSPLRTHAQFTFEKQTLNGDSVSYYLHEKCISPDSKVCQCDKFEDLREDSVESEVVDLCDYDVEKVTAKRKEKQKLTTVVNHLRSPPVAGKNGYPGSRPNSSQHGLLIVPNGYHHNLNSDPRLHYHNYNGHTPEHETVHFQDGTLGTKTNDKNSNYIYLNGIHMETLDVNANTNENMCKPRLNKNSNGFSKPYCFNCGECGHLGTQCSTEIEESIVTINNGLSPN